jgi:hypothetical protein
MGADESSAGGYGRRGLDSQSMWRTVAADRDAEARGTGLRDEMVIIYDH